MSEFNVLEESPLSLAELKEHFKSMSTDQPLPFRAEKTKTYLDTFVTSSVKETKELTGKVTALNIPRLKDRHIIKIVDVMPKDIDSLRMLLSNETLTIKDEDLKKILDVIPQ